jgi:hypothetical protein
MDAELSSALKAIDAKLDNLSAQLSQIRAGQTNRPGSTGTRIPAVSQLNDSFPSGLK